MKTAEVNGAKERDNRFGGAARKCDGKQVGADDDELQNELLNLGETEVAMLFDADVII